MQDSQKINHQHVPEISVVVLGYKANQNLKFFVEELVNFLENDKIDYQIVLVGNYWPNSGDETPAVVSELAWNNNKIKPIIKPKEGYMGWDMRSGLEVADGKFIAIIDGDGQMPAEDIMKVYKKIKEDNFDLVKTYREKRMDNLWRKIISYFYNLFFKILFPGLNARDINSKPKIFTKEFLDKLNLTSNDWFADAEIMIGARRFKINIGEVPTIFKKNEKRPSFVKFPAIFEFIKNLIIFRIKEFKYWKNK